MPSVRLSAGLRPLKSSLKVTENKAGIEATHSEAGQEDRLQTKCMNCLAKEGLLTFSTEFNKTWILLNHTQNTQGTTQNYSTKRSRQGQLLENNIKICQCWYDINADFPNK